MTSSRQTVPMLLAMLSGGSTVLPTAPCAAGRDRGQAGSLRLLQSVTASHCKSSNAKVLFGAVKPHGFSLSTLEGGRAGEVGAVNEH